MYYVWSIMSTHIYELAYLITVELLLFSGDEYSLLSLAVTDESNEHYFLPIFSPTNLYTIICLKCIETLPITLPEKIGIPRILTSTNKNDSMVGCIIYGLRGYAATR